MDLQHDADFDGLRYLLPGEKIFLSYFIIYYFLNENFLQKRRKVLFEKILYVILIVF